MSDDYPPSPSPSVEFPERERAPVGPHAKKQADRRALPLRTEIGRRHTTGPGRPQPGPPRRPVPGDLAPARRRGPGEDIAAWDEGACRGGEAGEGLAGGEGRGGVLPLGSVPILPRNQHPKFGTDPRGKNTDIAAPTDHEARRGSPRSRVGAGIRSRLVWRRSPRAEHPDKASRRAPATTP